MYLERVRLVEDTALKAAGGKTFAGSIPVLSVFICYEMNTYLTMETLQVL